MSGACESCGTGTGLCNGACATITNSDNACGAGACAAACSSGQHCANGTCQVSKIEHVVLIVEENHSFESYFGAYCLAAAGSNPRCTLGRNCCESAPVVNNQYTEPRKRR